MEAAGWTESRLPKVGLIFDALYTALEDGEDPTAKIINHFWRGAPHDLAFTRPDGQSVLLDSAPAARFWRSEFITEEGFRAFVGTVGLDDGDDTALGQTRDTSRELRNGLVDALISGGAIPWAPQSKGYSTIPTGNLGTD